MPALLLTGCGSGSTVALHLALPASLGGGNPYLAGAEARPWLTRLLFPGLRVRTASDRLIPGIARQVSYQGGGVFQVTLAPLHWSNGAPVTARDVAATWQWALSHKVRLGGWAQVGAVQVLGPRRLQITWNGAVGHFTNGPGTAPILPRSWLKSGSGLAPSSGPYRLVTADGQQLTLASRSGSGLPSISLAGGLAPEAAASGLLSGAYNAALLPPAQAGAFRSPDRVLPVTTGTEVRLLFLEHGILAQRTVRQALSALTPVGGILHSLGGWGAAATADLPPQSRYRAAFAQGSPGNPRALLQSAGAVMTKGTWKIQGQALSVPLDVPAGNATLLQAAQAISRAWQRAGIQAPVRVMAVSQMLAGNGPVFSQQVGALLEVWRQGRSFDDGKAFASAEIPANSSSPGENLGGFSSGRYDAALASARNQADFAGRLPQVQQMEHLLVTHRPAVFLYWQQNGLVLHGIRGIRLSVFGLNDPQQWQPAP